MSMKSNRTGSPCCDALLRCEDDAMTNSWIRRMATTLLAAVAFLAYGNDSRGGEYRIAGPFVHENLAVYLVHGISNAGPVPMTLQEATAKKTIRVIETKNVNELTVENLGDDDVFIQSGEVVKGGAQDRVMAVSIVLPPRSGPIPISAFCVERGRWFARGTEDPSRFQPTGTTMPPRGVGQFVVSAVTAFAARQAPQPAPSPEAAARVIAQISQAQAATWSEASRLQADLARRLSAKVERSESPTSLALTLDDQHVRAAQNAFVDALEPRGIEDADVVGYIMAVDGRLETAQIYVSNGLFRKMWPELLRAAATEAIASDHSSKGSFPSAEDAESFLSLSENGKAKMLTADDTLELRDDAHKVFVETRRSKGSWIARSYHAK
jgi:ARG/rhodanese/phosphatase superfamily protein